MTDKSVLEYLTQARRTEKMDEAMSSNSFELTVSDDQKWLMIASTEADKYVQLPMTEVMLTALRVLSYEIVDRRDR